jgi:hypothetical protein
MEPDAIERQLAHQELNAVRRAHTHGAEYWSERVSMMQAWADYLDRLREAGAVRRWSWLQLLLQPWPSPRPGCASREENLRGLGAGRSAATTRPR